MKKLAFILAAVLLMTSVVFTGCTKDKVEENENNPLADYLMALEDKVAELVPKTELDNEILGTVNGLPISAAGVRYTTWVLKAPGTYTEEEVLSETEKFFKENAALIETCYENGIEFTEDNVTELKANISGMELQLGEEYDAAFAESPFTKFYYYFQMSGYQSLYNNLYTKVSEDRENEITKAAFEEAKSNMVRAKHILIQFPAGEGENGEMTDEQKEATLAKANEVLDKVNAMADISEFDALIAEYNEDPGMETYKDGYYFGRGEMVPEFEESAYSLSEGETSGLVETSYGYHILLKLPLESDDEIYASKTFGNTFNTKLYEYISAKVDDYTIEYNENYDARVEEFVAEYNALLAAEESETAETTESAE